MNLISKLLERPAEFRIGAGWKSGEHSRIGETQSMTTSTSVFRGRAIVLALAGFLACGALPARSESFSFTSIGDLPGGSTFSRALAVSGNGQVVGGVSKSTVGVQAEATSWTKANGLVPLGDLAGGTFESYSYAVSNDGSVIVGIGSAADNYQAFRVNNGVMTAIPYAGTDYYSEARGVSANGNVIVGLGSSDDAVSAWRWTQATGTVSLGFVPGDSTSSAYAISADGSTIVGFSGTDYNQAMRYTSGGGMVSLGHLPGGTDSAAFGVSRDGSVVVGYSNTSATDYVAFRWDAATNQMVSLGDFAGGFVNSQANGVSGNGKIVVGYGMSDAGFDAFRWDPANGLQSLKGILNRVGLGPELNNWILVEAKGISDDGRSIVGYGFDPNGNTTGWIARNNLLADVNVDWKVDIADLVQVANLWLSTNPEGDANGDGIVNIQDITAIAEHWLEGAGGGGGGGSLNVTAVPEPSTLSLAAIASLAGAFAYRRRRSAAHNQ